MSDASIKLDRVIEAVLFYKAAPVRISELQNITDATEAECREAIATLACRLETGATRLLQTDREVSLVLAPEFDDMLDTVRHEESNRSIGKAGAETLAIVLYRGPISRGEIDRIRGVNSTHILRTLATRGLVATESRNGRTEYRITPELLAHLGVRTKQDLPEYEETIASLEAFESQTMATV